MYDFRYERTSADYIEKLPKGKHSCKGVGKTTPNPSEKAEIDGAEVPFGKGVKQSQVEQTDLLYNEYIVSWLKINTLLTLKNGWKLKAFLVKFSTLPKNVSKHRI